MPRRRKELAPEEDQGILFNIVKTPQYANLDYLEQSTQRALQGLRAPCPRRSTSSPSTASGGGAPGASPASCSSRGTSASARRSRSWQSLQPKLASIAGAPGARLLAAVAAGLDRRAADAVRDHDDRPTIEQLAQVLEQIQQAGRARAACSSSPTPTCSFDTPQVELKIDHDKANRLGITHAGYRRRRWRRCSAATTSTASTSTAAATR